MNKKQIIYHGAFKISEIGNDMSLTDFALRILTDIGGIAVADASDYVTKYSKSISNNLKKQNDELRKRGITMIGKIDVGARISWISSNYAQNLLWKLRPIYLDIIDSLTDEKFEALCCLCISLIGGNVWRTKNKGDGNVDLYGIVNTQMDNHLFGYSNRFRIAGQCKNYSHQESVTNFESFFQALNNVRFQAQRVIKEMPNDFIRENGPIFGWYICKDGFQSGVFEEARKHGVVLSDKYDLAEILVKLELKGISKSLKTLCLLNFGKSVRRFI